MSQLRINPNGAGSFGFQKQDSYVLNSLPHNLDYEQNVLGCCLINNQLIGELGLVDGDFYDRRHSKIFFAMNARYQKGLPSDDLILSDVFEKTGEAEEIGGLPYLDFLSSNAVEANVRYYAQEVKKYTQQRVIWEIANRVKDAIEQKKDPAKINTLVQGLYKQATICRDNSLKPVPASELRDCEPVPTVWGNIIYPACITQMPSPPGIGKTTFLYNLCIYGALGKPFLGIAFSHRLKILYADAETPTWKRANKLKTISEKLPENLFFLDSLDLKSDFPRLLNLCKAEKYDLIVLDTQGRIFGAEDENDNSEANYMMGLLQQLTRETGCAIVLVHHIGKSESTKGVYRGRGASAIAGAVDVIINMEALDSEVIKLEVVKNRIVGDYPTLLLQKLGEDEFAPYNPPGGNSGFEIFQAQDFILSLDPEKSWHTCEICELGEKKGFNKRAVERALSLLVQTDKIGRVKKGLYIIRQSATSATYRDGGTVGMADSGCKEDFPEDNEGIPDYLKQGVTYDQG